MRAVISAVVFALAAAAQQDPVFRSSASLVRLDVEATDASGNILTGLTADDFRILDEGAPQAPVAFSFEQEPLDLILLFDTSHAMSSHLHQTLRAVELGFHELHPDDRAAVMTFTSFTEEVLPFTASMDAVNQTILLRVLGVKFAGNARPDLAASEAARRFLREPQTHRRRAILIVGGRSVNHTGDADAIRALWASDAVLSQLIPDNSGANRFLPVRDFPVAHQSGGAAMLGGDPGPAFQDSLRRLRRRYTLYYNPPQAGSGKTHRVEVRLSPAAAARYPGAELRARTGYINP